MSTAAMVCDGCGTTEPDVRRNETLGETLCDLCYGERRDTVQATWKRVENGNNGQVGGKGGENSETAQTSDSFPSIPSNSAVYKETATPLSLPFSPLGVALANAPTEPEWMWSGYLARRAVTLTAGRPKVGKSTLVFGLARALETGALFLGRATQRTGICLLSEEREDTLAEKKRRFGLGEANIHLLMRHTARGYEWPEIVAAARDNCLEHDLGLLVVDTWDKWAALGGDSENSAGAVNEALAPLLDAAASGLAILIVTHHRKSGGKHGEAVRGSNALTGAVDVVLEVDRLGDIDPEARVLRAESRYSRTPSELVARLEDDEWSACGTTEEVRAVARKQDILEVLAEARDGLTYDDVGEKLDKSGASMRRPLDELYDEGKAAREGEGKRGSPYRFLSKQLNPIGEERNATPEEEADVARSEALFEAA